MPRKGRQVSKTGVYHWIVRGIHRKKLFHRKHDFRFFENLLMQYKDPYEIAIYHYCYMTNHVHLLLQAPELESLSRFSHYVQRRYAYYYCGKYKWNGNVFQRRYQSYAIDKESYLLECGRYIERNPIKAGIVNKPNQYPFSSYSFYVEQKPSMLLTPSPAFLALSHHPKTRKSLYQQYVTKTRIQEEMMERCLFPKRPEPAS